MYLGFRYLIKTDYMQLFSSLNLRRGKGLEIRSWEIDEMCSVAVRVLTSVPEVYVILL